MTGPRAASLTLRGFDEAAGFAGVVRFAREARLAEVACFGEE
ncbi:MAG: hypothetical protein WAV72_00455 [Bradyrhizobium sp.]